jgi:hypothetical protein
MEALDHMDDEVRDPREIPSPLFTGCRSDCLAFVEAIASHFITNQLLKRILKWTKMQKEDMKKVEALCAGESPAKPANWKLTTRPGELGTVDSTSTCTKWRRP